MQPVPLGIEFTDRSIGGRNLGTQPLLIMRLPVFEKSEPLLGCEVGKINLLQLPKLNLASIVKRRPAAQPVSDHGHLSEQLVAPLFDA